MFAGHDLEILGQPSFGCATAAIQSQPTSNPSSITNNPAKYGGLDGYGLDVVGRVALPVRETPHNVRYLRTKRERMHHELLLATDVLSDARV